MAHAVVTAVGRDRPGIVAAVTEVLVRQGCNLEDTSMTILRGHFAMMLVVDLPPGLATAELESALGAAAASFELIIAVRPIGDDVGATREGDPWTLSVYGADRPGIVHAIATMLADLSINIVDLSTRFVGTPEEPVYAMLLEVRLPPQTKPQDMGKRLAQLATELGVETSMNPAEADIL